MKLNNSRAKTYALKIQSLIIGDFSFTIFSSSVRKLKDKAVGTEQTIRAKQLRKGEKLTILEIEVRIKVKNSGNGNVSTRKRTVGVRLHTRLPTGNRKKESIRGIPPADTKVTDNSNGW